MEMQIRGRLTSCAIFSSRADRLRSVRGIRGLLFPARGAANEGIFLHRGADKRAADDYLQTCCICTDCGSLRLSKFRRVRRRKISFPDGALAPRSLSMSENTREPGQ